MCFDIDVKKYSLQGLHDTHARIASLLNKPSVVERLPDKGYQLRRSKLKVIAEIRFRESLNLTHEKMQKLSLKCASETDLENAHSVRLCSLERKPALERLRPNLSIRSLPSGHCESMRDLRTGIQLIDLPTSLHLQRQQEDRTKAEQFKAKQDCLMAALMAPDDDDESCLSDSDCPSELYFEASDEELDMFDEVEDDEELVKVVKDYVFNGLNGDEKKDVDEDEQPGPSGVQMVKIDKKAKPEVKDEAKESSEESDDIEPATSQATNTYENLFFRVKKVAKVVTVADAEDVPGSSGLKLSNIKEDDEEADSSNMEDAE